MKPRTLFAVGASLLLFGMVAHAEVKVVADHNRNEDAGADFKFKNVPPPARNDAAAKAAFTLVDGQRDPNGGDVLVLHDGKLPAEEDAPSDNFFFRAGTDGGRLLVDLGSAIEIKQVNTYSWHPNTRGPQVYKLYASDGKADGFNAQPKKGTDPATCGWKLVADVDTRPKTGEGGGQYGVSISDSNGTIGKYQYLLFDISRTENEDPFGNTFFSEIDVIDRKAPAPEVVEAQAAQTGREIVEADGGKYRVTIDTSEASDLSDWAHQELAPMVQEWYPKLIKMLPSEGYEAPQSFSISFSQDMKGVAATGGTRIRCAASWMRQNLKGEAKGAVFHEMVHLVQQYGRTRRSPDATRSPGWLTEGIADYLRWFIYEPQTHGAEITKRNLSRARYDGNYRITANFLNWASEKHGKDFVSKLNAAIREGRYNEDLWKTLTGHTVQELGEEWKAELEKKLGSEAATPAAPTSPAASAASATPAASKPNTLTDEEKQAGWKLLFNGQSLDGWHNFKSDTVRPGWQVKDGILMCADPRNAGDLCTNGQFDWFELQLEYNISEAGNSGIIYHVTDQGGATWATGPEVQLEDNAKAADPVRCAWLYALYQPPVDPKTGKPLDTTRPVGEWNQVRLLVSPEKCEHAINGVKYFEYVLGSDDFKARVAKSKFARMPLFAKSDKGYLALQGDHGQVSFRNIKLRPLEGKK